MSAALKSKLNLSGRKAFVTGSSTGIGKAIALSLAEFGAFVIVHSKDQPNQCRQVVQEIVDMGESASYCTGDIGVMEDIERIRQELENVDILVLNASIQIKRQWADITQQEFDDQMTANVWAGVELIKHVYPAMKSNGWGRILFLGSVQQVKPHSMMLAYAASKAAISNLTINLASQFAFEGITVNNMAPGVIATERNTEALNDKAYAKLVKGKIPSGDFGLPEDCAGLALLLCSDAGRYITGQSIYVDGGMSL